MTLDRQILDDAKDSAATPCFTPGTHIATPRGERKIEDLKPGDAVVTRDNGLQAIRWVGAKVFPRRKVAHTPHLRPILIRARSLGNGLPERDMMVSPNHRMLVTKDRTSLPFDEPEVLVAAKHMVDNRGVCRAGAVDTCYIHILFDRHQVVLANGAWTESFQPDDHTLKGIGNAQRTEILELFPELGTQDGLRDYTSARRTLTREEAIQLVD